MRTIEDVVSLVSTQLSEMPQIEDTASAGLGLVTDMELYVRDAQDINGNSKIRKFFYKLLAPDELKESAGLKQSEEIRSEIAMAQRRIEGLKAELVPADHVFLEGAVELYRLLSEKNKVSKEDLVKIRQVVDRLYSINDSMATDKALQLVDSILHTLLADVLSAKATFGVSLGAKIFLKSVLVAAKKIAEKENSKQEAKTLEIGKEIKDELSKLDKFMVDLISRGEDKDFSEYSNLLKSLFSSIESLENRQEMHKYILAVTKVNIHELVSTPDLVQNMRMLKYYEKNSTNISHVTEQAKLVKGQISRLLSAKKILAEKSPLPRNSAETIKAEKIEILLNNKIEVLQKELSILEKTISKLQLSPQAMRSVITDDGSKQKFHKDQVSKDQVSSSENKKYDFKPGLMPGSGELNNKNVKLEEAHRKFIQSPKYQEYEKEVDSLKLKVEAILGEMRKLKDSPSQYEKASKSLDKYLPKIRELMGKGAMIAYESGAPVLGFDRLAREKVLNSKNQELENLINKIIEARTGTSPEVFATKAQSGTPPASDKVTTFHTVASPAIPAKTQSSSESKSVYAALKTNSMFATRKTEIKTDDHTVRATPVIPSK